MAAPKHILWIKTGPLLPLDSGGKIRTHAMLRALSQKVEVTYLALHDSRHGMHPDESADPYASRKIWIPWSETRKRTAAFYLDLVRNALGSTLPYAVEKYRSPAMTAKMVEIIQSDTSLPLDLVVCDFLFPAANCPPPRDLGIPIVLFQHNVEAEIWRRLTENQRNPIARAYLRSQYHRMRRVERELSKRFTGVIAVSDEDATHFRDTYQLENVLGSVPTGVDTSYFSPEDKVRGDSGRTRPRIAYLGSMDWLPNIDAVSYYVRDVLPTLIAAYPDLEFVVIGRNPAPSIVELARNHPSVVLTGTVDDVRPHLLKCDHLVVPLRAGGGTRIKIFEAMSLGVPVVSTRIGAEGLPVEHDRDLLLADTPEELSAASLRLLRDPATATRLAHHSRERVVRDHSWDTAADRFLQLCPPSKAT